MSELEKVIITILPDDNTEIISYPLEIVPPETKEQKLAQLKKFLPPTYRVLLEEERNITNAGK